MKMDLTSPIPILSNKAILAAMSEGLVKIHGFVPKRLAATAYQITPSYMRFRNDDIDGLGPDENVLSLNSQEGRSLRPGEYAIVSPKERIELGEGFVADFYPSSWCVDKRLILTAGRQDAHYDGQLVFGLYNGGSIEVIINADTQIARATFGWLGRNNMPDYSDATPAMAYNQELQELRMHEDVIAKAEEALRLQKEEIAKRRKAISLGLM